jgi:hypothetical protein
MSDGDALTRLKSVGQCKFAGYSCNFNTVWLLLLTFARFICICCLGIGQIGANFNIFVEIFNADCAKDICQGGRAVDGTKSGGRRDHVVLHPQQFHCVRPWRGYHVSSTMTLHPNVGKLLKRRCDETLGKAYTIVMLCYFLIQSMVIGKRWCQFGPNVLIDLQEL